MSSETLINIHFGFNYDLVCVCVDALHSALSMPQKVDVVTQLCSNQLCRVISFFAVNICLLCGLFDELGTFNLI